jgi:hypothetical protein
MNYLAPLSWLFRGHETLEIAKWLGLVRWPKQVYRNKELLHGNKSLYFLCYRATTREQSDSFIHTCDKRLNSDKRPHIYIQQKWACGSISCWSQNGLRSSVLRHRNCHNPPVCGVSRDRRTRWAYRAFHGRSESDFLLPVALTYILNNEFSVYLFMLQFIQPTNARIKQKIQ